MDATWGGTLGEVVAGGGAGGGGVVAGACDVGAALALGAGRPSVAGVAGTMAGFTGTDAGGWLDEAAAFARLSSAGVAAGAGIWAWALDSGTGGCVALAAWGLAAFFFVFASDDADIDFAAGALTAGFEALVPGS